MHNSCRSPSQQGWNDTAVRVLLSSANTPYCTSFGLLMLCSLLSEGLGCPKYTCPNTDPRLPEMQKLVHTQRASKQLDAVGTRVL